MIIEHIKGIASSRITTRLLISDLITSAKNNHHKPRCSAAIRQVHLTSRAVQIHPMAWVQRCAAASDESCTSSYPYLVRGLLHMCEQLKQARKMDAEA
jgi:hypothetical protein